MGSDLSTVNAARVSFAKESDWEGYDEGTDGWKLSEKDQKLISYLAKHNHFTPFCHSFLSFRIKAPTFVARQLVKHQVGLSWNEESRRYIDDEPEFYIPDVFRSAPVNAKQGSGENIVPFWSEKYADYVGIHAAHALKAYNYLLWQGVAPEQARMVLPLNTMTNWIWSGSLAAFARVCKLRLDPHAQKECQEIAQKINDCIPSEMQHSWKALID